MQTLEQSKQELETKKRIFDAKKKDHIDTINYHIGQMKIYLDKMKTKNIVLDMRDSTHPYYKNDVTGELEYYLIRIKKIFSELAEEESNLVKQEQDIEGESLETTGSRLNVKRMANEIVKNIKNSFKIDNYAEAVKYMKDNGLKNIDPEYEAERKRKIHGESWKEYAIQQVNMHYGH